jgi:hypothetical protein
MVGSPDLVFTADLHFDETGAWRYKGIVGDAQHAFDQVVAFCCAQQVPLLALGGDILDKPSPRPETVKYLRRQFDLLAHHRVQVVYILGQHDGRQDWPSIHPDPIHLHGRRVTVGCVTLHGFDYLRPEAFRKAYTALEHEPVDFVVCHQVWKEFMGNTKPAELALADLPFALPLLTGDYHVHTQIGYQARDGTRSVAYSPGSTHMRDVAEDPEKRFYAFHQTDAYDYRVESIPLDTRHAIRVKLTTPAALEKFLAEDIKVLPLGGQGIERMIVDVTYYDDLDDAPRRLAAALEDRCYLFLKPRRRRRDEQPAAAGQRRQAALGGLPGIVSLACEPGPVRDSVLRLLEAPDQHLELAAMKAEFFTEPGGES